MLDGVLTFNKDSTHNLENKSISPDINFELIEVWATFARPSLPKSSVFKAKCSLIKLIPCLQAVLYPEIMTEGWIYLLIMS